MLFNLFEKIIRLHATTSLERSGNMDENDKLCIPIVLGQYLYPNTMAEI